MRWTREVASSSTVNMPSYEKEIGLILYVVGALEYDRLVRESCTSSCRLSTPSSSFRCIFLDLPRSSVRSHAVGIIRR